MCRLAYGYGRSSACQKLKAHGPERMWVTAWAFGWSSGSWTATGVGRPLDGRLVPSGEGVLRPDRRRRKPMPRRSNDRIMTGSMPPAVNLAAHKPHASTRDLVYERNRIAAVLRVPVLVWDDARREVICSSPGAGVARRCRSARCQWLRLSIASDSASEHSASRRPTTSSRRNSSRCFIVTLVTSPASRCAIADW